MEVEELPRPSLPDPACGPVPCILLHSLAGALHVTSYGRLRWCSTFCASGSKEESEPSSFPLISTCCSSLSLWSRHCPSPFYHPYSTRRQPQLHLPPLTANVKSPTSHDIISLKKATGCQGSMPR